MTDWSTLVDACGNAAHVPELLDRFAADPAERWSELMDHLCPQLDCAFPASFAALPDLAAIAAARPARDRGWALLAMDVIIDCASPGDGTTERYAIAIGEARRLTADLLRAADDPAEYLGLLQSLLTFEGVEVWNRCLDGLATGEYEIDCPACEADLFVHIDDQRQVSTSEDCADVDQPVTLPLRAAEPEELGDAAGRLYGRARADGRPIVADRLRWLFGRATCPHCGATMATADRVEANHRYYHG